MKKTENKISDLLGSAMNRAGIMREVRSAVIVQAGNDALVSMFDDGILQFAQSRSYDDGRLSIACVHAALAQEINLQNKALIDLITQSVPGADVREIHVVHRSSASRGASWYEDNYATS